MLKIEEQLNAVRLHLLAELEGLGDDQLNWKPDDSTWSISQVVQHIAAAEGASLEIIRLGLKQEPTFVPGEIPMEKTALDRSFKVKAPEFLNPSAQPKTIAQLKAMLNTSRNLLLDALDSIEDSSILDQTTPPMPHPVFGQMSSGQWLALIPFHEERHILQIKEVKERLH